jgi:C_GCAxxG_C_C family probable redox protein
MSTRKEEAANTFTSGCNCAQSVLTSFYDILEKDRDDLLAVSAGFGGGMGKLQDTCGAVTGAYMVFGHYAGKMTSSNDEAKELSGKMVRAFHEKFMARKGATSCREILGVDMHTEEGQREINEKNLMGTVCVDAVKTATEIVEEILLDKKTLQTASRIIILKTALPVTRHKHHSLKQSPE